MKIRKQVYELTLDDVNEFPIWEFALDEEGEEGQDEATVRPCEVLASLDPANGMFIVRAMFTLADGSKMQGYLTPPIQGDDGLGTLQPVIITPHGQVMFWYGALTPDEVRLAESYEKLGRGAERVFPIEVASQVELVAGPIRCVVPGFVILEDFGTRKTRTVK
jgi:hypothetical protein